MSGLLSTLFIFVTLMVMGYILVRKGLLSKNFSKDASSLAFNVLICATVINSVVSDPPELSKGEMVKVMGLIFLLYAFFYVVAVVFCRLASPDRSHDSIVMLLMAVNNNIFIGVPVVQELFGQNAVLYVTLGSLPFHIILYSFGAYCLLKGGSNARKLNLKDIFAPPLNATIVALILYFGKIQLPAVLVRLISILSSATLPISMLVIGAILSTSSLAAAFKNYRFYIVSFVKLIVMPVLVWLVFRNFISDPVFLGTSVIVAACPTGLIVSSLCVQYDKDAVFPAESTLLCTILSMITIPIITAVLL